MDLCQSVTGWNYEITRKLSQNLLKNSEKFALIYGKKFVNFFIRSWKKYYEILQSFASKNRRIYLSNIEKRKKNANLINILQDKTRNSLIRKISRDLLIIHGEGGGIINFVFWSLAGKISQFHFLEDNNA